MRSSQNQFAAILFLLLALGGGLLLTHMPAPMSATVLAAGPASGATTNAINAVSQKVALFVPAGGAVRLGISGTFAGTLTFYFDPGTGTYSSATLTNCNNPTATGPSQDTSATATGTWLYTPTSGSDGTLVIQATAWTSGTAVVSLVDLVANPQNMEIQLLPSAARTTQQTITFGQNPCWKGIAVTMNVSVASGTGGLQTATQIVDPITGSAISLDASSGPITVASFCATEIYPGLTNSGTNLRVASGAVLPRRFQIVVTVEDASSYTYSLSCSLLK